MGFRDRIRPWPMRVTGWLVIAVGLFTISLNLTMDIVDSHGLLPGGHSPWYFVGGGLMACAGLWWTGAMDAK